MKSLLRNARIALLVLVFGLTLLLDTALAQGRGWGGWRGAGLRVAAQWHKPAFPRLGQEQRRALWEKMKEGRAALANLTKEQRQAVRDKVRELRQNGATRNAALDEMLKEYGVSAPNTARVGRAFWHIRRGRMILRSEALRRNRDQRFLQDAALTKEQRQALRTKIEEMHESGASRAEIREAVSAMLREFGIELPIRHGHSEELYEQYSQAQVERDLTVSNYPNPFNPETKINYTIGEPVQVTAKIYDIQGRLLRTLVDGQQEAGEHIIQWDGRTETGEMAVSGTYFCRINAGGEILTKRMVLMK